MVIERNIELRPCTAFDRAGQHITFAQDQIFLNGYRIGYVGHAPGDTACLIRPVDKETSEAISAVIAEARNGVAPSSMLRAPVIEQQETDDDDE